MKKHNFSAGPCILPQQVLLEASESIMDFNRSGLSLIEISHRSKAFVDVIGEAKDIALDLLNLNNKGYKLRLCELNKLSNFCNPCIPQS